MHILVFIFILVPAIEIGVFIWTGSKIGALAVVGLIIVTGILGAALVRQQGIETWRRAQTTLHNRELPREQILDGICIILGGILLIAPGFITDIFGLLLVLPWTRSPFRAMLSFFFMRQLAKGNFTFRRW